jgi:hypothetical protein
LSRQFRSGRVLMLQPRLLFSGVQWCLRSSCLTLELALRFYRRWRLPARLFSIQATGCEKVRMACAAVHWQ